MEITLTAEESAALQRALRIYGSDLRMEIVGTDNATMRQELKHERATLEAVVAKLDDAVAGSSLRDDQGRVVVRLIGIWTAG